MTQIIRPPPCSVTGSHLRSGSESPFSCLSGVISAGLLGVMNPTSTRRGSLLPWMPVVIGGIGRTSSPALQQRGSIPLTPRVELEDARENQRVP